MKVYKIEAELAPSLGQPVAALGSIFIQTALDLLGVAKALASLHQLIKYFMEFVISLNFFFFFSVILFE